ncbi:MAG TPA: dihydropyrimidinase [Jatrophihabitans sp.]|nr:dihydropyrimidinase [Jatrophihabitans sp.]
MSDVDAADLIVVGGTVVTESWTGRADVLVRAGTVAALLEPGQPVPTGDRVVDATGKLVLPGGVDPHCHIGVPLGEFVTLDDYESATLAALAGGTTTIVDFAIPTPDETSESALTAKLADGASARCDFALHGCITDVAADIGKTVRVLTEAGVRTIKLFTTYRDLLMVDIATIEQVMTALREIDGLTYVHAEANDIVESCQQQAAEGGYIDASGMARTRPTAAEERAVADVLGAADRVGAPVYFVHQSSPGAVDQVIDARRRGVRAFSESCPHYLSLDETVYQSQHPERYVCCPPLRDRGTVEQLGARLAAGFVDTVGSDHCCYDSAQKLLRAHDVRAMPNGLPGVETRLPIVWDAFVNTGLISAQRFVALVAANPARLNGLFPRKGTIAPGADADLVIFDPKLTRTVHTDDLHMMTDYTPYEGRSVTGWPVTVISRGRIVLDGGVLHDPGPAGEYLRSGPVTIR